jgi:hypothetical protein
LRVPLKIKITNCERGILYVVISNTCLTINTNQQLTLTLIVLSLQKIFRDTDYYQKQNSTSKVKKTNSIKLQQDYKMSKKEQCDSEGSCKIMYYHHNTTSIRLNDVSVSGSRQSDLTGKTPKLNLPYPLETIRKPYK